MDANDNYFMRALLERIDKMLEEQSSGIIDGHAQSFEDYRSRCASVKTLRDIADHCVEIRKKMIKEMTQPIEEPSPVLVHKRRS